MLLQVDSTKVSYAEYFYEGGWLLRPLMFLIATFIKVLRIKLPPSTDIPPVENVLEHLINPAKLDGDLAKDLQPLLGELEAEGFQYAGTVGLHNPVGNTRYGGHVLFDPQRQTIAWLRTRRIATVSHRAAVSLYSLTSNGEVVMTTGAKRDILDPPQWHAQYFTGTPLKQLLESHQTHVASIPSASIQTVNSDDEALGLLQSIHAQFIDFQIDRQVFQRPLGSSLPDTPGNKTQPNYENPDDLALNPELQVYVSAVREIENKQTHWLSKIVLLAVSIAAFVAMGAFAWDWQFVVSLIPILLIHELGHFVAMKMFGYRNVKMFFIPLFGAAVSGRHYNIPAWKKAIVALAGPVPSIMLAIVVGTAGMIFDWPWTESVVGLTLILNVLNLLPFLPLDGGWVAHVTLFSRSAILDLIFRIITMIGLAGLAILLQARFMFVFVFVFGFSMMNAWKTAQIVQRLRNQPVPEPGNDQIPVAAIELIVPELKATNLGLNTPKQFAQQTIAIYESVITRPPGLFASLALLTVHAMTFIGAFVFAIVLAFYINRDQFDWGTPFEQQTIVIEGEHQSRLAPLIEPAENNTPSNTETDSNLDSDNSEALGNIQGAAMLIWEFQSPLEAQQNFEHLVGSRPNSTVRFGNLVFTSVAEDQPSDEESDSRLDQWVLGPYANSASHSAYDLPTLTLTFETKEEMQLVIDQLNSIPELDSYYTSPWQTEKGNSGETESLRKLLHKATAYSWLTEAERNEWSKKAKNLNLDFENDDDQWLNLLEDRQQFEDERRDQWFNQQLANANEDEKALLNAAQTWQKDETGELLLEQLFTSNLLKKLGHISTDSPIYRTSLKFRLSSPDGLSVNLYPFRSPDPAAALESLHTWLKRMKTKKIEMTFWTQKD